MNASKVNEVWRAIIFRCSSVQKVKIGGSSHVMLDSIIFRVITRCEYKDGGFSIISDFSAFLHMHMNLYIRNCKLYETFRKQLKTFLYLKADRG